MTCCNNNCNQGRNCPARVAKVGQRFHAAEPLSPNTFRRHLRHLAKWMLICWALLFYTALLGALVYA